MGFVEILSGEFIRQMKILKILSLCDHLKYGPFSLDTY